MTSTAVRIPVRIPVRDLARPLTSTRRKHMRYRPVAAAVALATSLVLGTQAPVRAAELDFDRPDPAPGNLRFGWIHGSQSAKHNTDLRIQVHRYEEHTYILRQNPAVHWEAPFMYLLFGADRALLIDSGATEEAEYFPLRETVDALITRWAEANGRPVPELIVLATSDAPAQTAGLVQFEDRPATTVIAPTVAELTDALALDSWPTGTAQLDLGGRVLDVLPTPGVSTAGLSIHDPWTDMLFTGTTVLPGRIVIRDFDAYMASIERLVAFSENNPVRWVMGAQIDMSRTPGVDYRLRSTYRPTERALQLDATHLVTARNVTKLVNGREQIEILADFIIMNGVGRGARRYGYPVYSP